jgi:hypothetical protein
MQYQHQSSMSSRSKQIKITFKGDIKTTSNVNSYSDLVRYIFNQENLKYSDQVPTGVDEKLGHQAWFNFWFEDAQKESYTISNEEEFQQCMQTYANLKFAKITCVPNEPVQREYLR